MNEELHHVFDFAIADRAALPLLPHLDRALVAAALVDAVVVHEDAVLRVDHAEAAHPEVAVVDVLGDCLRVRERNRPADLRLFFHLVVPLFRELLHSRENALRVLGVLIGILLDVGGGLAGGTVVLRVEALRGPRRRRTNEKAVIERRQRELLARLLARAHARVLPLQRVRSQQLLAIHVLNDLILYLKVIIVTRRKLNQSCTRKAAARSHMNLRDLDGRRRRNLNLAHDMIVRLAVVVRARIVVATQLPRAICVFITFTAQFLIFTAQLITILRSDARRRAGEALGARRHRDLLGQRQLLVRLALHFARRIFLTRLGHFAFAIVLGARLLTSRSGREQTLTYLQREVDENLIRRDVRNTMSH